MKFEKPTLCRESLFHDETHKNIVKRNLLSRLISSHCHLRENETTESRCVQLRVHRISRAAIYFDPINYHAKDLQLENFCWNDLLVRRDFNYE